MTPEPRFYFAPGADLSQELQRIVLEQQALIREQLQQVVAGSEDIEEPVHEARKALKRLRAFVRLLRGSCEADDFTANNEGLRDAARLLSSGRDAHVIAQRFRKLLATLPSDAQAALADLQQDLQREAESVGSRLGQGLNCVRTLLTEVERSLADALPRKPRSKRLLRAAEQVYRRARQEMRLAEAEGTEEHFHEWRKSIKYLRHHLELLQPSAPELLGAFEQVTHDLADVLGENQDLSVLALELEKALAEQGREDARAEALQKMLDQLKSRQQELQTKALQIGRQVLAETPSAYRRRLRAYRDAAQTSILAASGADQND